MWNPFRRKKKPSEALPAPARYILARKAGTVTRVMYDFLEIDGERYDTKTPMVALGHKVKKGQPVGK